MEEGRHTAIMACGRLIVRPQTDARRATDCFVGQQSMRNRYNPTGDSVMPWLVIERLRDVLDAAKHRGEISDVGGDRHLHQAIGPAGSRKAVSRTPLAG